MKPKYGLTAPGQSLSSFAFKFDVRRYYEVDVVAQLAAPTYVTAPGPGRYEDKRTGFKEKPYSQTTDTTPFHATSRRFDSEKAKVRRCRLTLSNPG